MPALTLANGQRGLLAGKTGTGKTFGALFLLRHTQGPIVILDSKIEPAFDTAFPPADITHQDGLTGSYGPQRIRIVRPAPHELIKPAVLDAWLMQFDYPVTIFIDELYQIHSPGGRAGPGLVGLLTRGRSKGVNVLMATQRPRFISGFCLTEADKYYVYWLSKPADRKVLAEATVPEIMQQPPPYHFWFYSQGSRAATLYTPVPAVLYREV